ncbi:MAG: COG3650 family protein [Paracoccaceae bacterium]
MKRFATTLGLALCPVLAAAQPFPATYSVTGITANDVLNVRGGPSLGAPVLGEIGSKDLNIEVLGLSADGKWGKVGLPEGNGWVAMSYLQATLQPDDNTIPRPLSCRGTEPFWSVSLSIGGAQYNSPDTGAIALTVKHEAVAPQGFLIELEEGPALTHTLIVTRETCSDGMSDRIYGFAIRMFSKDPNGNASVHGCCTLDHR